MTVVSDTTTAAAHGEGRTNDRWEAHHLLHLEGFFHAVRDSGTCRCQPYSRHRLFEFLAVFRHVDSVARCADHLDFVFFQHAVLGQIQCAVQRSLTAHRRQDRIRTFLGDDLFHHLPSDGLDIGRVRHIGVGHDGRRVRVHQNDAKALFTQRLASLSTGIVELARLPDDDGARANDQD